MTYNQSISQMLTTLIKALHPFNIVKVEVSHLDFSYLIKEIGEKTLQLSGDDIYTQGVLVRANVNMDLKQ